MILVKFASIEIFHFHCYDNYISRQETKNIGLIKDAIADYEKCIEMQSAPHITDGLYSLAQVHEMLGDYKAAIKDNERIIRYLASDFNVTSGEEVDSRKREIERLEKLI